MKCDDASPRAPSHVSPSHSGSAAKLPVPDPRRRLPDALGRLGIDGMKRPVLQVGPEVRPESIR